MESKYLCCFEENIFVLIKISVTNMWAKAMITLLCEILIIFYIIGAPTYAISEWHVGTGVRNGTE